MPLASLGGIPFRTGPSEIRWDYRAKVAQHKTMAGRTTQILGVSLSDMTLTGRFGVDHAKGDTEAWQEEERFRVRVLNWAHQAQRNSGAAPLRFTYPPRNWDFKVFVKAISDGVHDVAEIAPQYTITLFVLEDSTRQIVKGVKDLYMKRLMDGVGWKQTKFNGPVEGDISELLQNQTVGEYLASESQQAFESGLPGGSIGGAP